MLILRTTEVTFHITAAGDFDNYATIDAENFNVTAVNNFTTEVLQQSMRIASMLQ